MLLLGPLALALAAAVFSPAAAGAGAAAAAAAAADAALAPALSPRAATQPANPAGYGFVQFNITLPPSSPILSWAPGLSLGPGAFAGAGESDAPAWEGGKNGTRRVSNATKEYWWTPTTQPTLPYYINFTDYSTEKNTVPAVPAVGVRAFANNIFMWGGYDGWNVTQNQNEPLRVAVNGGDAEGIKLDALGGPVLASRWNMSSTENNLTLSLNPDLVGGAAVSINQVTITTYMDLGTNEANPDWHTEVNETYVPFVSDGRINYLSCDDGWGTADYAELADGSSVDNYTQVTTSDAGKSCTLSIPKGTSYIVLYGTMAPDARVLTVSGLDSTDRDIPTWAVDTVANATLLMHPLDPNTQYTASIVATTGPAGLHGMTLYSRRVPPPGFDWSKVPWRIIGAAVGGAVGLLLIAIVVWRFGSRFFRRRRRRYSMIADMGTGGERGSAAAGRKESLRHSDMMELPLLFNVDEMGVSTAPGGGGGGVEAAAGAGASARRVSYPPETAAAPQRPPSYPGLGPSPAGERPRAVSGYAYPTPFSEYPPLKPSRRSVSRPAGAVGAGAVSGDIGSRDSWRQSGQGQETGHSYGHGQSRSSPGHGYSDSTHSAHSHRNSGGGHPSTRDSWGNATIADAFRVAVPAPAGTGGLPPRDMPPAGTEPLRGILRTTTFDN